jgi:hypothetical protein
LKAFSNYSNANFTWFSGEQDSDTLFTGAVFQTRPLLKSTKYFIEATTTAGCRSGRRAVSVTVVDMHPAQISIQGDSLLRSNYTRYNTWAHDGTFVGDNSSLKISQPGVYTLTVDSAGCHLSDTINLLRMRRKFISHDMQWHPNPVTDFVYVTSAETIESALIFDMQGRIWRALLPARDDDASGYSISMVGIPAGFYQIVIHADSGKRVIRVVKVD